MRMEHVMYLSEKEEECARLLMKLGMKKNVAHVLVFLAHTPETTSHEIERGTGLRQPEISAAMRYLMEKGWVASRAIHGPGKGRPMKIYQLARPIAKIVDSIESEKKKETTRRLARIKKAQDFVRRG